MNENSLLLEKAIQGDKKAEEELVINNMGLVKSIAKRFSGYGCDFDDLSQIGAMGLIKAIKRFDTSYGVQFSTYAVPVIMGEIKRFLRDDGMIKISRSIKENAVKGKRAAEVLRKRSGYEPTIAEISKESGIGLEELVEAFEAVVPVDTITPENDDGMKKELAVSSDEGEEIINKIFVGEMLESLKPKEKQVLVLRYFSGKTQAEVAKKVGVSQVQVSRIEKGAIERLKKNFA